MSNTYLTPVYSRPTLDFIEGLAAASATFTPPFIGSAIYNLPGIPLAGSRRFLIRAIEYVAVQNVGLEFDFFSSATGLSGAVATQGFIGRFQFASTNGAQFNSAGLYQTYIDGLAIPYYDLDVDGKVTPPTLHVAVQNVDTVAKTAAAAGAIAATFWLEAMQAW